MPRRSAPSESVRPLRRRPSPTPEPAAARVARRALRVFVAVVAFVLVVDSLFGDHGFLQTVRARYEYDNLATSIARLREENARLREEARRLRDDPAAVEDFARRELDMIRPGEILVIVRDAPPGAALGRPRDGTPFRR